MKRVALTLVAVLGASSVHVLGAPAAARAESVNDCVQLSEGASGDGLRLAIDNRCERALSCSLAWTLQCESAIGRVTKRAKDAARLTVGASASVTTTASAKACGDNWKIEDVTWACVPAKAVGAVAPGS